MKKYEALKTLIKFLRKKKSYKNQDIFYVKINELIPIVQKFPEELGMYTKVEAGEDLFGMPYTETKLVMCTDKIQRIVSGLYEFEWEPPSETGANWNEVIFYEKI